MRDSEYDKAGLAALKLKELIHQPGKPAWGLNQEGSPNSAKLKELIHQPSKPAWGLKCGGAQSNRIIEK